LTSALQYAEVTWQPTAKLNKFELPPPEFTNTNAACGDTIRFDVTTAVSWVAFTNVVGRAVPSKRIAAPETKLFPFTVRVRLGPPGKTPIGLREVIVGPGATVKFTDVDVTPPLVTVTLAVPGVEIRPAATVAVRGFPVP
jgi:hypothetical protein